jgi:hypothetical protein
MSSWDAILARYRVKDDPLYLERRIELFLIFFFGLLLIQLLVGFWQVFADSSPKPKPPASEILDVVSVLNVADITPDLLRELIERPLFWEGRKRSAIDLKPKSKSKVMVEKQKPKPKLAKEKAPAPPKTISQHVNVVGIFDDGDSGGAILNVHGKEIRFLIGEFVLDGWKLSEVDENKVVFTYGSYQDDRHLRQVNPLACKIDPSICQKQSTYVDVISVGSWSQ